MRIAVLEDDADQAERVRGQLAGAGHVVHLFPRGRQLLAKLAHESYDLIIIDWEVPDLSGYDALKAMRGPLRNTTPILFLHPQNTQKPNNTYAAHPMTGGTPESRSAECRG